MFKYGSSTIEVVSEYVYLGVTMLYSNKYAKAMKKQMDQARKAQFALLINARKLCLPIDIQCYMFEKVVSPILLYGSEVWGFSCTEMLEIFHRNFLKINYCIWDLLLPTAWYTESWVFYLYK